MTRIWSYGAAPSIRVVMVVLMAATLSSPIRCLSLALDTAPRQKLILTPLRLQLPYVAACTVVFWLHDNVTAKRVLLLYRIADYHAAESYAFTCASRRYFTCLSAVQ